MTTTAGSETPTDAVDDSRSDSSELNSFYNEVLTSLSTDVDVESEDKLNFDSNAVFIDPGKYQDSSPESNHRQTKDIADNVWSFVEGQRSAELLLMERRIISTINLWTTIV